MPTPSPMSPPGSTPGVMITEAYPTWQAMIDTHMRAHSHTKRELVESKHTSNITYGCDLTNMLTNICPNSIIADKPPVQSTISSIKGTQTNGQEVQFNISTLLNALKAELSSVTTQIVLGHFDKRDQLQLPQAAMQIHRAVTALFGGHYGAYKKLVGDTLSLEIAQYMPTQPQYMIKGNGIPSKREATPKPKPKPTATAGGSRRATPRPQTRISAELRH